MPKNNRKQQRLFLLIGALATLTAAVSLMLIGLNDNIVFFHSPAAIAENPQDEKFRRPFRIGGLVKAQSAIHGTDNRIEFILTDNIHDIKIIYHGILPDLFRDGQGIVATGQLNEEGHFIADRLLAKHDENYMPREAVQALREAGVWKGN